MQHQDMNAPVEPSVRREQDTPKCLARSVVDALDTEPSLEAVTINRSRQTISVATLGKTNEERVAESITGRIQKAYEKGVSEHCLLLEGEGNCATCDAPLSDQERKIRLELAGDGWGAAGAAEAE